MRKIYLSPILILTFLLLQSCANYKVNYSREVENWATTSPSTDLKIKHTIYAIGDIGYRQDGNPTATLDLLKQKLDAATKNSTVLFLGNSVPPSGLTSKKKKNKQKRAKAILDLQLETIKDFKGKPVFLPGNHEWSDGLKGLDRVDDYLKKRLNKEEIDKDDWEEFLLPEDGCADPEVIEISKQLVIIAMDSNWWLRNWNKDSEINDGCYIKSREDLIFLFENIIRKHRDKNVIIAMHHPLYSGGPRAGNFTAKQHLFPLRDIDKKLYIPLPVLGSVYYFLRGSIGSPQDLMHHNYREMKEKMLAGAKKNGSYIFLGAHEHSLQYAKESGQHFVVSGSGSKKTAATINDNVKFAYGEQGFSQMDFYDNGEVWLKFWAIDKDNKKGKVVFYKKIKEKLELNKEDIPDEYPELEKEMDSIQTRIVTQDMKPRNGFYQFLLGKHYRQTYLEEYKFPVLNLRDYNGGLEVVKRGGGNQTNSLRMVDKQGREYALRAMTKDASRFLPYPFNKLKITETVVKDNFLSTHPFAPIAVSVLANAVNVYHTNPSYFYIPKQPVLGVNNDLHGNQVYMLEERPDDDEWDDVRSLGYAEKVVGTDDVEEDLIKNHKYKVDQPWAVRSRLFDMVIGDWDRHDDQWRWARLKQGDDSYIFRPIPRDRDQAFSKYDGLVAGVARLTEPFLKQLNYYRPDIKNMKWGSWSARRFDKSFLNEMDKAAWEKEANYIKENLTNEVIDAAFKTWPKKAQEFSAESIKTMMKSRRDKVLELANRHYKLLAKYVDVYGTNDRDRFEIERLSKDKTRVSVFDVSDKGKIQRKVYERTFLAAETKEIHIYGDDDDDEFILKGTNNSAIKVRIIGGLGKNVFKSEDKLNKIVIYDNKEKDNTYELQKGVKIIRTKKAEYNIYNRKDPHYEYDYATPLPIVGFNPDNGLLLGVNVKFKNYTYKKVPHGQTHLFKGTFAFETKSFELAYQGDFIETFDTWDMLLNAQYRGASYAFNYFGWGNESVQKVTEIEEGEEEVDIDYYRFRQGQIFINPNLKKRFLGGDGTFMIGPIIERTHIQNTPDRLVVDPTNDLPEDITDSRYYAGIRSALNYANIDDSIKPAKGFKFKAKANWEQNLETNNKFTLIASELTLYQNLDKNKRLVIATQLGGAYINGTFDFFQAPNIGAQNGLRGYRNNRFYGNNSFYHSSDLRICIKTADSGKFPLSIGLIGGYDYGRVWATEEESDKWHSSYGGGLWLAPLDAIVVSLTLFKSEEDLRFAFKTSFPF